MNEWCIVNKKDSTIIATISPQKIVLNNSYKILKTKGYPAYTKFGNQIKFGSSTNASNSLVRLLRLATKTDNS